MSSFKTMGRFTLVVIGVLLTSMTAAVSDQRAAPGDVARFVAGMEPSAGSPLAELTAERSWRQHANHFNQAWKALTARQLDPIAAFQKQYLPNHSDLMLYLFSGPDFLYANAFYPNAKTYIMTGLEPVGRVPSVTNLSAASRAGALQSLRASMQTIVNISFFITKKMREQLQTGSLTGTLPVIYVFMARAGKDIQKVELVNLNADGTITPRSEKKSAASQPGAKITFTGKGHGEKTLYYFRTDLSNGGLKVTGLKKFVESLGPADALVKSASYLMHGGHFSMARDLIFKVSNRVLQDDSGIPLRFFDKGVWDFKPFGYYLGPIAIFSGQYQSDMKRLFNAQNRTPINFGFGYKWRPNQSNVLLATKKNQQKSEIAEPVEQTAAAEPATEIDPQTTGSVSNDPATDEPMEKTEQKAAAPETQVAAFATCSADCASVHETCSQTADQRMETCFKDGDTQACLSTWKTEAGVCISERMACTQNCN